MVFTTRALGQGALHALHETLHVRERLLLALLLGEARVPGQVAEGDGHAHAAEVAALQVDLHVPDHVLLHEVLEEALVDVVHDRRGQRQQVPGQGLHLLGHLQAGHPLAHQGLVHVDVEQADLGVSDLREGLPVDPRELEEGDQREARPEHRRDVLKRLHVFVAQRLQGGRRQAAGGPEALDQRGLEAGGLGGVLEAVGPLAPREGVLDEAVGEPPLVARLPQARQRVAASTQTSDDPGVGDRRRAPAALAVAELGDHA